MLKRERAVVVDCEGCFFYLGNTNKGELHCSKPATPTYAGIYCVEYDEVDPNQLVYHIFVEAEDGPPESRS